MTRKRTSVAEAPGRDTPIRVVMVTMDAHLASATQRAAAALRRELPGLSLSMHVAADWGASPATLERCREAIAAADIIVVTMLFMEDHFQPVLDALAARRDACDALVCAMSAGEVMKLTRMGGFRMDGSESGAMSLLKRLRPKRRHGSEGTTGAQQMRMLRRIPKLLRFIPGTAQDVRAYFLTLQYFFAGSEANVANMVRALIARYADGPRRGLREYVRAEAPVDYPEVGVYHPALRNRISASAATLPAAPAAVGTVGLLVLRSYVLAGNSAHYDGVIRALEARGLRVVPAFASGLDVRPAVDQFFVDGGVPRIDALVSLTGFSLVGGPAYNDAKAAEEVLVRLDVPYVAAHPVEFQTLEEWADSGRGLLPVESTMMVAIPELDGATAPTVFGGRVSGAGGCRGCARGCEFPGPEQGHDMRPCPERADALADRVARLVALRRSSRAERKVGIVLFNFPPHAGNSGTAAFLAVFESLQRTLTAMAQAGYTVNLPASADELRERIIHGNAAQFGALANVHARIPVDDHVRRERWLAEIESQWGRAPGKHQSDGRHLHVLGERFGNVFVGVQPSFGYEGDPMRLLFEKGFAPTHAFSAFYRYLREDFGAHVVLHFGTHGALEFMPGKQTGLSGACWPERLMGNLPNVYLYASNNPSEGTIAKRRSAATLVSYLTPPIARAGLYKGLCELKESVERWRMQSGACAADRAALAEVIQAQASGLDLASAAPAWGEDAEVEVAALGAKVLELEYTLIPHGLHVVGGVPEPAERVDLLLAVADGHPSGAPPRAAVEALVAGRDAAAALAATGIEPTDTTLATLTELARIDGLLAADHEIAGLLRALDGRFLPPSPGGDLLRTPQILPTGRNLHGFDPFRIPSAAAVRDGARQATRLLERHVADGQPFPESIAMVLWGTDNLKTEGGPIAQALALLGARPRFDGYGRLAGAELIPLAELGRPRVDVVATLSGIFRDLLPLQIKLLAEAAFLAAAADEPAELNFVRKHALQYQADCGCDLETAALRVFGNAEGAYGANVSHLIENSRWDDEDELAETYTRRKSFAFGRSGRPAQQAALLQRVLANVDLAYQNLDSVEVGVTTVDTYFDTLGGISRAVRRAKGGHAAPVYIGDETQGAGTVRTLAEQVALETRTRMLNPKWHEGMLKHGYEGVRQIEIHVTNTMGWSATTGEVAPWVYEQLTRTFMLDPEMRERLAKLNPAASAKVASRLLEAHERHYWSPDEQTLEALRRAGEELEDRVEGVVEGIAA
ncbi:MAG: magnesium chelatase subunit H [Proteobacteria bacterium]|nr:magnesium chelatase subunit H [Pseudomonadota bacterium]